ncbi:hypothetical protein [Segatella copri]|uniref:hypothetical protein n=1 Tax=Segatella copri TaxID=165179 RepID=UPI003F72A562
MKEKKYHLQEDHGAAFAEEPTPVYHENTTVVLPGKKIAEDNFDDDFEWDRIPEGWGPINEEEAIARIEAIEADIEQNGLIDEEDMIEHLKAKGLWLI